LWIDRVSTKINKILFHRRDAEFAESEYLFIKILSLRPRRLRGKSPIDQAFDKILFHHSDPAW